MALDGAKFLEVQQRAKKIMEMDRHGQLDKIAKNASFDDSDNINFESQPQQMIQEQPIPQMQQAYRGEVSSTSKLPKEILESFKTNTIDTTALEARVGQTSVLDALRVPHTFAKSQRLMETPKQTRQVIQEQVPTQLSSSNIDYSLIKTIIEDCIKKSMTTLKKSMLTENTNNGGSEIALMKLGEGFKFVTKNGDIYEAKLKKVGNVNGK